MERRNNGIRTRFLNLAEKILFSEKDFAHAVRKWALSWTVPQLRAKQTYAYSLLLFASGGKQVIWNSEGHTWAATMPSRSLSKSVWDHELRDHGDISRRSSANRKLTSWFFRNFRMFQGRSLCLKRREKTGLLMSPYCCVCRWEWYLNSTTLWHGLRQNKQTYGEKNCSIRRKNRIHIYTYINSVHNFSGDFNIRDRKITIVQYFRTLQFKITNSEAIIT